LLHALIISIPIPAERATAAKTTRSIELLVGTQAAQRSHLNQP
jgi:hypothetical protein